MPRASGVTAAAAVRRRRRIRSAAAVPVAGSDHPALQHEVGSGALGPAGRRALLGKWTQRSSSTKPWCVPIAMSEQRLRFGPHPCMMYGWLPDPTHPECFYIHSISWMGTKFDAIDTSAKERWSLEGGCQVDLLFKAGFIGNTKIYIRSRGCAKQ